MEEQGYTAQDPAVEPQPQVQVEDGMEADEWTFIDTLPDNNQEQTATTQRAEVQNVEESSSDSESIAIIQDEPLIENESLHENADLLDVGLDNSDTSSINTAREYDEQLPEDFCLKEDKIRSYIHRRNNRLSTLLNVVLLGTVITTAGIAVGHMWGINDDCSIDMTNSITKILLNVQKLQEENEYLRSQIKVLKMNRNMPKPVAYPSENVINLNIVSEYEGLKNSKADMQCWERSTLSGSSFVGPNVECEELNNEKSDDQNQTEPNENCSNPPPEKNEYGRKNSEKLNAPSESTPLRVKREKYAKKENENVELKREKRTNKNSEQKMYKKDHEKIKLKKKNENDAFEKKLKNKEKTEKEPVGVKQRSEWYLKMGDLRRQLRENMRSMYDRQKANFAKLSDKAKWYFKRMDDREKKRHHHDEYKWSLNKKMFYGNIKSKW